MTAQRILVIDDDENMTIIIKACLELMGGFNVTVADNGRDGLLNAETEQPAAILVDLMMPEMDGIALLKKLQSNPATQKTPVILLTAKVHSTNQQEFSRLGFAAVVAKPFEPVMLVRQVSEALQ